MNKKRVIVSLLLLILIAAAIYLGKDFLNLKFDSGAKEQENGKDEEEEVIPEKKLQIIDLDSKTRPIGVMVDNVKGAWPQAGLDQAFLVYEIIVEGGQTRLFALFKDKTPELIGPVRSSRHYFLDYAMENDAIYAHYGWSPQAIRDISAFSINNLNGMSNAGSAYWRSSEGNHVAPHNVFTTIQKLTTSAEKLKYKLESNQSVLLNYSVDEINLNNETNAVVANSITLKYSQYHTTSYTYDSTNKVYNRFINGNEHKDMITGSQYSVKNIIIVNAKNYNDPENSDKGRQALDNVGTGSGYFVTNGYSIPITWEKSSRREQTVYKKMSGEEIKVNDGNTYIQIQPIDQIAKFE
jgi:hypothetical protein